MKFGCELSVDACDKAPVSMLHWLPPPHPHHSETLLQIIPYRLHTLDRCLKGENILSGFKCFSCWAHRRPLPQTHLDPPPPAAPNPNTRFLLTGAQTRLKAENESGRRPLEAAPAPGEHPRLLSLAQSALTGPLLRL